MGRSHSHEDVEVESSKQREEKVHMLGLICSRNRKVARRREHSEQGQGGTR